MPEAKPVNTQISIRRFAIAAQVLRGAADALLINMYPLVVIFKIQVVMNLGYYAPHERTPRKLNH